MSTQTRADFYNHGTQTPGPNLLCAKHQPGPYHVWACGKWEIDHRIWPAPQKLLQSLRESSRTWEGARRTRDVEEAKAA